MTQTLELQVAQKVDTLLWEKIQALDLSRVRNRLIIKDGYTAEDADATIAEYRQYLYIAGKVGNVAPGTDCDDAWHAHMLHLPMYVRDCLNLFGRVLWHVPNETTDEEVLSALETPRRKKVPSRKLATEGRCGGCFCAPQGECTPSTNCQNGVVKSDLHVAHDLDKYEHTNSDNQGVIPMVGTDCESIRRIESHITAWITVPKDEYASMEGIETKSFQQIRKEIFG